MGVLRNRFLEMCFPLRLDYWLKIKEQMNLDPRSNTEVPLFDFLALRSALELT